MEVGYIYGKLNSYNIAIGEDPNAWSSSLAPTDFGGLQQDEQQERRISALVDPESGSVQIAQDTPGIPRSHESSGSHPEDQVQPLLWAVDGTAAAVPGIYRNLPCMYVFVSEHRLAETDQRLGGSRIRISADSPGYPRYPQVSRKLRITSRRSGAAIAVGC